MLTRRRSRFSPRAALQAYVPNYGLSAVEHALDPMNLAAFLFAVQTNAKLLSLSSRDDDDDGGGGSGGGASSDDDDDDGGAAEDGGAAASVGLVGAERRAASNATRGGRPAGGGGDAAAASSIRLYETGTTNVHLREVRFAMPRRVWVSSRND